MIETWYKRLTCGSVNTATLIPPIAKLNLKGNNYDD